MEFDTTIKCRLCNGNPPGPKLILAKYKHLCDNCYETKELNPPEQSASKLIDLGKVQLKQIDRKPPSPIQGYRELKENDQTTISELSQDGSLAEN